MRLTSELVATGRDCPAKVETFYAGLNQAHHTMYEKELVIEAEAELPEIERTPRTGITARYPADVVKARGRMSELIASYCIELDAVVNSKNTAQAEQVIGGLSDKVQHVGGEIMKASSVAPSLPMSAITALAAPIKTLASLGIQGAFGFLRENWAKDTINRIDAGFEDVCTNMERDLDNSAQEAKDRAGRLVALYQRRYDRRIKQPVSEDERKKLLIELSDAGHFYDSVAADNPAEVFEQAKQIFHKLATWASQKAQSSKWKFWSKP